MCRKPSIICASERDDMWRGLGDLLVERSKTARCVILIAPYIKSHAMERLLRNARSLSQLICVTRWFASELAQGVSDIEVREATIRAGGKFLLHENLHAKYYRFDEDVFVGSANLTDAALGWSRSANLEILYSAGEAFDFREFEKEVLRHAREVGDLELRGWKLAVENARGLYDEIDKREGVNREWSPKARDVDSILDVYSGRRDAIVSEDERNAAMADVSALEIPDGLGETEVLAWVASHLVSSSFVSAVVSRQGMDSDQAARELAEEYGRGVMEARRDLEAVHNWLSAIAAKNV